MTSRYSSHSRRGDRRSAPRRGDFSSPSSPDSTSGQYIRRREKSFPEHQRSERPAREEPYARTGPRRPPCPHYPACASCPFIHFPYLQQLEKKRNIVVHTLNAYPTLASVQVPSVIGSPRQFGYRTRVKLAVRRVGSKVVIGLYRPETHDVVDTSMCPVHPEPVNGIVQFLQEAIERLDIAPYDEGRDTGQLRYIDIRYSIWQKQAVVTLVTRHMHFPQARELVFQIERRFPFVSGIVQNIHDKPGNVIWGDRFHPLRGRDTLLERIGPFRIIVPVGAFSQVNPPVARRIYETAHEWLALTGQEIALDLYCGIGPISLYLASRAKLVIGIDDNEGAINVAKQNARKNGYHNCRFFAGDAAEKLREMTISLPQINVLIANPPRKGLSPQALEAVVAANPQKLVYISCEPVTLARDLDLFYQKGYILEKLQPFDMFPQTDQVETLAYLVRKSDSDSTVKSEKVISPL